jgi:MFS family permease
MRVLNGFFGWKVVWVAFLVAVFAWGVGFYGPSVFLLTLHATHGWSIFTISAAITVHFFFSAVIVTYLPEIHRRLGIARATCAGSALIGLGIVAWANSQQPWQLFLAAPLTAAGYAATSAAAINAMVSRWFDRDRPKALSIAFNGVGFGGLIFPPLWVFLISRLGFSLTAFIIAVAMIALVCPLASRFLGSTPAELGLTVDGCVDEGTTSQAPKAMLARGELVRDRRFVTLSTAFALGLFAQIGLFTHLIVRLAPEFGTSGAASAVSLATIFAIFGRTILGWAIKDHDRRLAASVNFLVQAIGVLFLSFGSGPALLVLGCMLFGLGAGDLISLPALIAQTEFERGDVDTVFALVTAINQAVFSLAPAMFGLLRDTTASYVLPFTLAATAFISAAIIVRWVDR